MTDTAFRSFLRSLNERRQDLMMTEEALARRSRLSRVTVSRLLSGSHRNPSFLHIAALAEALGVEIEFKRIDASQFAEQQARHHASRLVRMMQGTMGLEAQAVSPDFIRQEEEEASQRLLTGSWKKLWVE